MSIFEGCRKLVVRIVLTKWRIVQPDIRIGRNPDSRAGREEPLNLQKSTDKYLGIVTHLVLGFCVEIALSSSSRAPVRFSFLTRLFTAFSHHLSSAADPSEPFFQPSSRFTTGGLLKGNIPRDLTQNSDLPNSTSTCVWGNFGWRKKYQIIGYTAIL